MILDSSPGNLIREPALRPSQTQYSCRGKTKEQIILDSSEINQKNQTNPSRWGRCLTLHFQNSECRTGANELPVASLLFSLSLSV